MLKGEVSRILFPSRAAFFFFAFCRRCNVSWRRFYTCPPQKFRRVRKEDAGEYYCQAKNDAGHAQCPPQKMEVCECQEKSESECQRSPSENERSIFVVRQSVKTLAIFRTTGWIPITVKKKKYMESYETTLKTVSAVLQMTSTSSGSSSSPAAPSYFSSVSLGPFVIPWSADASIKKATVKTSKCYVT